MPRRSLPTVTAALPAAVAAALLLTACGGGDRSGSDDRSRNDGRSGAGSRQKDATPTAPRPGTSTRAAGRPGIELPRDVRLTFSPEKTGDATRDAVLADNAERIRAVDAAITGTDPQHRALDFYSAGRALRAGKDWVRQFKDARLGMTGTVHHFDRKLTCSLA
ncbi:hypothetical protein ACFYYR_12735 [Streptomyces sp. NPDC001922]|uniref:hypothetical protein n=1 Tax=Streptomyces sp. NPDC001922 TaxID=3364624 RepID=UPI0036D1C739